MQETLRLQFHFYHVVYNPCTLVSDTPVRISPWVSILPVCLTFTAPVISLIRSTTLATDNETVEKLPFKRVAPALMPIVRCIAVALLGAHVQVLIIVFVFVVFIDAP
jgi:hypothetical protein